MRLQCGTAVSVTWSWKTNITFLHFVKNSPKLTPGWASLASARRPYRGWIAPVRHIPRYVWNWLIRFELIVEVRRSGCHHQLACWYAQMALHSVNKATKAANSFFFILQLVKNYFKVRVIDFNWSSRPQGKRNFKNTPNWMNTLWYCLPFWCWPVALGKGFGRLGFQGWKVVFQVDCEVLVHLCFVQVESSDFLSFLFWNLDCKAQVAPGTAGCLQKAMRTYEEGWWHLFKCITCVVYVLLWRASETAVPSLVTVMHLII